MSFYFKMSLWKHFSRNLLFKIKYVVFVFFYYIIIEMCLLQNLTFPRCRGQSACNLSTMFYSCSMLHSYWHDYCEITIEIFLRKLRTIHLLQYLEFPRTRTHSLPNSQILQSSNLYQQMLCFFSSFNGLRMSWLFLRLDELFSEIATFK